MEVKDFKDSLFRPLMVMKERGSEPTIVSYASQAIADSDNWYQDECGLCYIPDLIKIEVTFDGDINDVYFDDREATIFSLVTTRPSFITDEFNISDNQNQLIIGNIINCFSGELMPIPTSLLIGNELSEFEWSYRIINDCKILPCVVEGQLAFEAIA